MASSRVATAPRLGRCGRLQRALPAERRRGVAQSLSARMKPASSSPIPQRDLTRGAVLHVPRVSGAVTQACRQSALCGAGKVAVAMAWLRHTCVSHGMMGGGDILALHMLTCRPSTWSRHCASLRSLSRGMLWSGCSLPSQKKGLPFGKPLIFWCTQSFEPVSGGLLFQGFQVVAVAWAYMEAYMPMSLHPKRNPSQEGPAPGGRQAGRRGEFFRLLAHVETQSPHLSKAPPHPFFTALRTELGERSR